MKLFRSVILILIGFIAASAVLMVAYKILCLEMKRGIL